MKKIRLTNPDIINATLNKLTPMWQGCINPDVLTRAQVAKSPTRNALFGTIINRKFIVLKKDASLSNPPSYSLADIYDADSASNLAGLLIYRLGQGSIIINEPKMYIAE